jgi:hypothetical protein
VREGESGTKVIFPVPGTITKCPLSVKDAVKECHSEPNPPSVDVLKLVREPGTFIIRIR